jgi:hypothetical protein
MRKRFGLLVVVASLAGVSVGASTAAFGSSHAQSLAKIRGNCGSGCGGGGGSCDTNCGGGGGGNDCSWSDCKKKKLGSPGADCTDNRLGLYSRVDNVLYICLLPKNNTPQAVSRSNLICETPTSRGGQGGTSVDADGLAFICLGPSGRQ